MCVCFYGNLAGVAESLFENVVVRIQPEADSGRDKYDFKSLFFDIQFLDKILSPIFGINKIRVEVQGSLELPLGGRTNEVDNPPFSIDMRKTISLDFDEKIQFNVGGNLGGPDLYFH